VGLLFSYDQGGDEGFTEGGRIIKKIYMFPLLKLGLFALICSLLLFLFSNDVLMCLGGISYSQPIVIMSASVPR